MMKFLLVIFVFFISIAYGFSFVKDFLISPVKIKKLDWQELFDLSKLHNDYVAQGIVFHENFIFFTVHEKDKRSLLFVFEEKDDKLELLHQFIMPKEATHTSDLTFNNGFLYAVDYTSTKLYIIDIFDRKLYILI